MATRDEFEDDDKLIDEGLRALQDKRQTAEDRAQRETVLAELSEKLDKPGIQTRVIERYADFGRALLADSTPSRVDPTIARALRPYLGDVSNVRVHTGRVATEAAEAMQARAFAIGDSDVFFDAKNFDQGSREGGALIAHELAHTRDASSGFALSGSHGNDTNAAEGFAEKVEMLFAKEWDARQGGAEADAEDSPNPIGSDFLPVAPDIDKQTLAHKIFELIENQTQREGERIGAWN